MLSTDMKKSDFNLPAWIKDYQTSAMEQSLLSEYPEGHLSFSLGLPAIEFFPKKEFMQSLQEHLALSSGYHFFQYAPPLESLKSKIVQLMQARGVMCHEGQILLTTGAQQGLSLLTRLLMQPKSTVILEKLSYPGFLQAIHPYDPHILTVATDPQTGIDVEAVERHLQQAIKPAFIYLVTDGGNPSSVSVSESKRLHLVQIAKKYEIPIIEDDPYGFLSYEITTKPLKAYEPHWVCYVGSFSKILAPSLRIGWMIVPESLMSRVSSLKESADVNTAFFTHWCLDAFLNQYPLLPHIQMLNREYKHRRDNLMEAIKQYFPDDVQCYPPSHGIFAWVEFQKQLNTSLLLKRAVAEANVSFLPSEVFISTKNIQYTHGMRLNFSHYSPEKIYEGVKRLGQLCRTMKR